MLRISVVIAVWFLLLGLACQESPPERAGGPASHWPVYASNPAGTRYSPLDEITPDNVRFLEIAWEYHTGDVVDDAVRQRNHSFQATPIQIDDALYFCTPRSRIVSLDAETGRELWVHDPQVDVSIGHYNLNCRGVAFWEDARATEDSACRRRIYVATADARLVSVDADTGRRCQAFGQGGAVEFFRAIPLQERREFGISSPPIIVNDVIVLGSSISEGRRIDMPSGKVQAFHARTGEPLWSWDPIPRDPNDPARASWEGDGADLTGAANVWSLGSADPERDLVFLPTSSPSPDFYGGMRRGENRWADSVVALRASTGEFVWGFQTVHHNLWDYDLASQPVLFDWEIEGKTLPAIAQATKMGHVFFLHRETGEPLVPVEERPVPQTDVPGEWTSPTQPFPSWPPPLVRHGLKPEDAWGLTPWDRAKCAKQLAGMRSEGIFTPPSFQGSVILPGTAGGSNWGSVAFDPERQLLFLNTSNIANTVQLVPREHSGPVVRDRSQYSSRFEQAGTPYVANFGVLMSPLGIPCTPPPWGELHAIDLSARELRWSSVLGTTRDLAPLPIPLAWGTPNMGGPLATAGGLVFIGAALDDYLRAYDSLSGKEIWKGRLPAGGQATPLSYRVRDDGRQFVVIAAGGHNQMRSKRGDSLVAFALPK